MKWIFLLINILILCAIAFGIYKIHQFYRKVRRDIAQTSQALFGTTNIVEGIQAHSNEPEAIKSVSGMTQIYLPLIAQDFPDFNLEEFKTRAATLLTTALMSITKEDAATMLHSSNNLYSTIETRIRNNQLSNTRESFTSIKIHKMEINRYTKEKGTCIITLQCSVEYFYTLHKNGELIKGSDSRLDQTKYNINLIYIQDLDKLDSLGDNAFRVITCPNCAGNMTELGTNICAYCGSVIEGINIKVWEIDSFREL